MASITSLSGIDTLLSVHDRFKQGVQIRRELNPEMRHCAKSLSARFCQPVILPGMTEAGREGLRAMTHFCPLLSTSNTSGDDQSPHRPTCIQQHHRSSGGSKSSTECLRPGPNLTCHRGHEGFPVRNACLSKGWPKSPSPETPYGVVLPTTPRMSLMHYTSPC